MLIVSKNKLATFAQYNGGNFNGIQSEMRQRSEEKRSIDEEKFAFEVTIKFSLHAICIGNNFGISAQFDNVLAFKSV